MSKVVIVAAVAVIFYIIAGCEEPPTARLENAKTALAQAEAAGAIRYAEPTYRSAEEIMKRGWMEMALVRGRLAPFRDFHAADSLLVLAAFTAQRAARQAIDSISFLEQLTRTQQQEMRGELSEWLESLNGSLASFKVKDYWMRADVYQQMADTLINRAEYEEALISMVKVRSLLEKVGDILEQHQNDVAGKLNVWRSWVKSTLELSRVTNGYAIIVDKAAHKTYLVKGGERIRTYDCELGYNSSRQKLFAGDAATPEGMYQVVSARHRGSKYYKALLLNYPNDQDKKRFAENKSKGIISRKARIGSWIEIHGDGGKNKDWTQGCVALTNNDMDHLMQYVTVGTPVTIVRRSDRWPG